MKKVKFFLISFILLCFLSIKVFSHSAYDYLYSYYLDGTIEKEFISEKVYNLKNEYEKFTYEKTFIQFLQYLYVYSSYAIMDENIQREIKELSKFVNKSISQNLYSAEVLNSYLDFIWSEVSWKKYNFSIINSYPVFLRNLSKSEKYHNHAMFKFASWYVFATDKTMSEWNTFIKNQEYIIEELNDVEKYNAYLTYSIFYMKMGFHSKGIELLTKAEKIFPENLMAYILSENYKKGVFGW